MTGDSEADGQTEMYGYERGAYHFFRPDKNAELQVRNFISQAGDIGPEDFPPILVFQMI